MNLNQTKKGIALLLLFVLVFFMACNNDEGNNLTLTEVSPRQPKSAEEYYKLGNILRKQGQREQAIASYQAAINLNPKFAEAHNNLGNLLQEQGQIEQAISSYQTAIKLNPESAKAHNNLADLLKEQGHIEQAISSYEQILRLKPDCDFAKFGMALAQLPVIYSTAEEIKLRRHNYQRQLQSLADSYRGASEAERAEAANVVGLYQPFYLA